MPAARAAARKPATRRTTKSAKAAKTAAPDKLNGIGSAAVLKATGKSWEQWLKLLDRSGAEKLSHQEIARLLHDRHDVPDWWSQMVTVGYEQARGRRTKHQTTGGFSISSSKTIAVPVTTLYEAWADPKLRERWLPGAELTIRKATISKSLRITWGLEKDTTNVDVGLAARGTGKSQVAVEHSKLKTLAAAKRAKAFWADRLAGLKSVLED